MLEILTPLAIVIAATILMLRLGMIAEKFQLPVSKLSYINTQFKYQLLLLPVAMLVLAAAYALNTSNFSALAGMGNIAAPAKEVSWMGIAEGESWLNVGSNLTFFITLATLSFVYLQFRKTGGANLLLPYLPWVLLFSLMNSFAEEAIFRIGILVPLFGVIDTSYVLIISAVAFGAPHLRGMPNGMAGMLMAGLLGWILAKSVLETSGVFWAWGIHFLQDIVIYSALAMAAAKQSRDKLPEAAPALR